MMKTRLCVVVGAGGHARSLVDAMQAAGAVERVVLLDRGTDARLPELAAEDGVRFAIGVGGVGDNRARARLFDWAVSCGVAPMTIRHPAAIIARSAVLIDGAQVLAGAIIGPSAIIGANAIINSGAIAEHDCVVGDHVHVATGARLCGGVRVELGAHVGAGAAVKQGVTVGDWAVVGLGAAVLRDVAPHTTVVGVPARVMRTAALRLMA